MKQNTAQASHRAKGKKPVLTLGPLYFNWSAEIRRDFYYRIADEADFDTVYVGEVVCSKREPFVDDTMQKVIERLVAGGKKIVLSTLALVTTEREMKAIEQRIGSGFLIEANDVACLQALGGKDHVIGPFINIFNESARDFAVNNGAKRIVLPVEIPAESIRILAGTRKTDIEVQVFGMQPLSVAMRCYHARAYGLKKDGCRIVCAKDAEGLATDTMDGQPLLTVNGTQTLSNGYGVLLNRLEDLQEMGVSHFRLSPQDVDMVKVAGIYRSVLDRKCEPEKALGNLKKIAGLRPWMNGFFFGREGMAWVD